MKTFFTINSYVRFQDVPEEPEILTREDERIIEGEERAKAVEAHLDTLEG